jgi:mutator protein MutT
VPVVAAVVRRSGRLLLCRRPSHKRHGGLWEFPGGKLGAGETFGEALRRELAEELGLTLTRILAHLDRRPDPGATFTIHFIEAEAEGEPVAMEHEEVAWMEAVDLGALPLAPGDRAFVDGWRGIRGA